MRVYSSSNTVTAYSSLTISPVPPTLTLNAAPAATAGVPYTINFSGSEVSGANYGITGWTINWGDGTQTNPDITTLPSDATSATHTYTTPGTDTIIATASDPYFLNTKATTTSQAVTVSADTQSVNAGGPYTISTGESLTLSSTAAGNLNTSDFEWSLIGTSGRTFSTLLEFNPTANYSNGYTTYQVTLTWAQLEAWGSTKGRTAMCASRRYIVVLRRSRKGPLWSSIHAATASFAGTNASVGGSSTVSFSNQTDQSAAERAGRLYLQLRFL